MIYTDKSIINNEDIITSFMNVVIFEGIQDITAHKDEVIINGGTFTEYKAEDTTTDNTPNTEDDNDGRTATA